MINKLHSLVVACIATLAATSANALSISAVPTSDVGPVTVDLVMNFEEATIGGGIIVDISGALAFASFTPSAYFNTLNTTADDTDFTGFGTNNKPASAEFELHFASFAGVSGEHVLGTLTLDILSEGVGIIDLSLSPDTFYGGFVDLMAMPQDVTLNDAQVNVVPLPAAAWFFATGMGMAAFWRRRRS